MKTVLDGSSQAFSEKAQVAYLLVALSAAAACNGLRV